MKIGIMGGTFDPIHNGHLMLGETAYHQFQLDKVWYMPNGNPPHKKQSKIGMDALTRMEMVKLAIQDKEYFELQDYEVMKESVSPTYQTLAHFREVYPDDTFYYIIGADSLFSIERWIHPELIFPNCIILAACRDDIDTSEEMNEKINYLCQKFDAQIKFLTSPLVNISSSELREKIKNGEKITGLVPLSVEEYIRKEGLYER